MADDDDYDYDDDDDGGRREEEATIGADGFPLAALSAGQPRKLQERLNPLQLKMQKEREEREAREKKAAKKAALASRLAAFGGKKEEEVKEEKEEKASLPVGGKVPEVEKAKLDSRVVSMMQSK